MSDALTMSAARKVLADNPWITVETVAAAELIVESARIEPNWRLWLLCDLVFVVSMLLLPSPLVRWVIAGYTAVYVVAMWRQRHNAARVIAENATDTGTTRPSAGAAGAIVAVVFGVAGVAVALAPMVVIRAVAVVLSAIVVRRRRQVPVAHQRARAVLEAARDTDWYAGWVAERDQHKASVRDTH